MPDRIEITEADFEPDQERTERQFKSATAMSSSQRLKAAEIEQEGWIEP